MGAFPPFPSFLIGHARHVREQADKKSDLPYSILPGFSHALPAIQPESQHLVMETNRPVLHSPPESATGREGGPTDMP